MRAWPVAHTPSLPAAAVRPALRHGLARAVAGPVVVPAAGGATRTLLPTRPSCGAGCGRGRPSCPRRSLRGPHGKEAGRTRDACGWRRPRLAVHSQARSLVEYPPFPQAWPAGNPPHSTSPANWQPSEPGATQPRLRPLTSESGVPGSPVVGPRSPSLQPGEPRGSSRLGGRAQLPHPQAWCTVREGELSSVPSRTRPVTSRVVCYLTLRSSAQGHSWAQHRPSWTGPAPDPPLSTWPGQRMDGWCPGSGHTEPSLGAGRSSQPPHTPRCPVRRPLCQRHREPPDGVFWA